VHQRELIPRRRFRLEDRMIGEPIANELILLSGKDVRPDIDAIPGRKDQRQCF
jgi:hypothetical protein